MSLVALASKPWDTKTACNDCPLTSILRAGMLAELPDTGTGETRTVGCPVMCSGVNFGRQAVTTSCGPAPAHTSGFVGCAGEVPLAGCPETEHSCAGSPSMIAATHVATTF